MSLVPKIVGMLPRSWIKAASRAQWKHPLLKRGFDFCADRFRNQDGTIQQGAGKGLRFNAGQTNAGFLLGTAEPGVQLAMQSLMEPGMIVYDIGANTGFLSVIAARLVGPSGCVICFEPLPSNAQQIKHNMQLNNFAHFTIRCEALGVDDGEACFLVSAEPTWGKLASVGSSVAQQVGEIEVPVRRLDTVLAEGALPYPDLIKIDVEGAEVDVLAGSRQSLQRARPILLIELHGTNDGVSVSLQELAYYTVVIGSTAAIIDSSWDAYVVATPMERLDLVPIIDELAYFVELR